MTEIELHQGNTLALSSEQTFWNDNQLAALRHMGVEGASQGDLAVYHHVCQRTGLDPFARQIHMIGRNTKDQRTDRWVTKYTIQTGIDGFRLIGRRAADAKGQTISVAAPQWAHPEGGWRDVWTPAWGLPIAARVTIKRNGEPFEAVALFDEYKQTKRDGNLTQMWAQRPAGQLAKCAEALAWRMAFPQDLSGIYTDDEMQQADRPERAEVQQSATGADRMRSMLGQPDEKPVTDVHTEAEIAQPADSPFLNPQSALGKRMFATFNEAGITEKDDRLAYVSATVGREVATSKEMTDADAEAVIARLREVIDSEVTEGEIVDDPTLDPEWGQK